MIPAFSIARLPRVEFGSGTVKHLPELASNYGKRALVVTGARSFTATPTWETLARELGTRGLGFSHLRVPGEPSPDLVDDAVREHAADGIEVVIGIGGGSALDAAKAIAGLLRVGRSVMDYLEGVGPELPYEGPAVPLIAVPTTAGTGSEATKNAVLSTHGRQAFKKSFRHDRLVAEHALVDPDLLASCPSEVIAANGMDALTQLLESYVSIKGNPLTDALAESGLHAARDGLLALFDSAGADAAARSRMAYASMLSGITLAQVGLGSVHGLASPLGALYPMPHGVVCGTLVGAATEVNIGALRQRAPDSPALAKYARAARILTGESFVDADNAWNRLAELLHAWTQRLRLPPLSNYGLCEAGLDEVVAQSRGSSMKTNPVVLTDAEIRRVLELRLG
jgi:alcohol dehydrogenase